MGSAQKMVNADSIKWSEKWGMLEKHNFFSISGTTLYYLFTTILGLDLCLNYLESATVSSNDKYSRYVNS